MPAVSPIRVLVAQRTILYGDALRMALSVSPDLEVIDEHFPTGHEAVNAAAAHQPSVVLLEDRLPEMEGAAAAAILRVRVPASRVILIADNYASSDMEYALAAGAVGYLTRLETVKVLADAIRRADRGDNPVVAGLPSEMIEAVRDQANQRLGVLEDMTKLTPREMEILRLLALGRSIGRIADELSIAEATVRDHFHNVVTKTKANSKEEAVAMARFCGLLAF